VRPRKKAQLKLLLSQKNRSYSAVVLAENLGGGIGPAKLKKILEEGVQSGRLCESGEGSKVYFCNQDSLPVFNESEMERTRKDIQVREADLSSLQLLKDRLAAVTTKLESMPSEQQFPEVAKQLQEQVSAISASVDSYRAQALKFNLEGNVTVEWNERNPVRS
jgi:TBPIP/Hop2 winged helix domain